MSSIYFNGFNSDFQVGINNGAIQLHVPPERPETPPHPLSTVPFRRDPDFVDRGTLLDQIREKCSVPASRIALVGLGGVGKSQLAIEYCYQVRESFPNTWVFWVHTSNAARFEQGFREIADRVKLPGRKDPKANIFQIVGDWLSEERRGKWILVLDNVDDDEFLSKAAPGDSGSTMGKSLLDYIPQSSNGSIIITSRSAAVAARIVEPRDIIAIGPMHKTDARLLFQKKLDVQDDRAGDEVDELMAALEYMPLAIVQAASYIRYRLPRFSVSHYLQLFQKSDRKKLSLLDYEGGHLRRDREAHNSIMLTWQISFDHLRRARPSAADQLSLMSFFDRQGIPGALLRIQENKDAHQVGPRETNMVTISDEESTSGHDDQFENDVMTLRDYSLISITDKDVFEMHRLVQLATRKWLDAYGQLEHWRERFIIILDESFLTGGFGYWERSQVLFPHVRMAVRQRPDTEHCFQNWAALMYKAAAYAAIKGNWAEAVNMAVKTERAAAKLLGQEHPITLQCTQMIGLVCIVKGELHKAELCFAQVMNIRKRVLGCQHPDTLKTMSHLASAYSTQARFKEAEELGLQIMKAHKSTPGPEHPEILHCIGRLSMIYLAQNRLRKAEELGVQVFNGLKRILGPNHPDTLLSMHNLANTYWHQDRRTEAEELILQVISTYKSVLGPTHPNTFLSMSLLAKIYSDQGRLDEAEEWEVQAMDGLKRELGPEHPSTLMCAACLAATYGEQGRWKEAQKLQVQVLAAWNAVLGLHNPHTLAIMHDLAITLKKLDQEAEALDLLTECTQLSTRVLGADDPVTMSFNAMLVRWQTEMLRRIH
ncbi:TPR-like protein [Aspergillus uvarum CBS 121591]|uniref:TPR-like protein n=1 Tax=Aspergillus uvarum CBS 121591 TaxID=1448315 RepID=A0A319C6Z8_9EURO|nr:TPR-like protein [Aspergillus uvarum CBS 121591]PYH80994.1 TPR-like protein [Aspergillus uvarum CBS 121591]